jgi:hypothetical protein
VNGYVAAELWDVIRGADGQLLAKEGDEDWARPDWPALTPAC